MKQRKVNGWLVVLSVSFIKQWKFKSSSLIEDMDRPGEVCETRCDQMWQVCPYLTGGTRCDKMWQVGQEWTGVTRVTSCDHMWHMWLFETRCDHTCPVVTRYNKCDQTWQDINTEKMTIYTIPIGNDRIFGIILRKRFSFHLWWAPEKESLKCHSPLSSPRCCNHYCIFRGI